MKKFNVASFSASITNKCARIFPKAEERFILNNDHRVKIIDTDLSPSTLAFLITNHEQWDTFIADFDVLLASPVLLEKIIRKLIPVATIRPENLLTSALQLDEIISSIIGEAKINNDAVEYAYKGVIAYMLTHFGVLDSKSTFSRIYENHDNGIVTLNRFLNAMVKPDFERSVHELGINLDRKVKELGGSSISIATLTEYLQSGLREFNYKVRAIKNKRAGILKVLNVIRAYVIDSEDEVLRNAYGDSLDNRDFQELLRNATIVRLATRRTNASGGMPLLTDLNVYVQELVTFKNSTTEFKVINNPYHGIHVVRDKARGVHAEVVSLIGTHLGSGDLKPVMIVKDIFSKSGLTSVYTLKDRHLSSLPSLNQHLMSELAANFAANALFRGSEIGDGDVLYLNTANLRSIDLHEACLMLAPFGFFLADGEQNPTTCWEVSLERTIFADSFSASAHLFHTNNVSLVAALKMEASNTDISYDTSFASEDLPDRATGYYGRWLVNTTDLDDITIRITPLTSADFKVSPVEYRISQDLLVPKNTEILVGSGWARVKRELQSTYLAVDDQNEELAMIALKSGMAVRIRDWLRNDLALAALHSKVVQEVAYHYVKETEGKAALTDIIYNTNVRTSIGLQVAYELIDALGGGDKIGLANLYVDNTVLNPVVKI